MAPRLGHRPTLNGFTRSVAGLLALLCTSALHAQGSAVYRCGSVYTNQPNAKENCVLLPGASPAVIEGPAIPSAVPSRTAQNPAPVAGPARKLGEKAGKKEAEKAGEPSAAPVTAPAQAMPESTVSVSVQAQRDAQAKAVLQAEWSRTQEKLQQVQAEYRQGNPVRLPGESTGEWQARSTQLRQNLIRLQADLASLKREMERR